MTFRCISLIAVAFFFATQNEVLGFSFPTSKHIPLVYGKQLRAVLPRNVPLIEDDAVESTTGEDSLNWWHSISRNNTIDCKCGEYSVTTNQTGRWHNEGIDSLNIYPWSVSIVAPGSNLAYCGGSLINDRFVLTSATCVDGAIEKDLEVLIGSWPKAHFANDPNAEEDEFDFKLYSENLFRKRIRRVILNPKYVSNILDYNIALLRLEGPVPTFGNPGGMTHVCLPKPNVSYDGLESSSLLWRFYQGDGFIIPEKRTEFNSTILSKEDCKAYAFNQEWEMMPDTMICANTESPVDQPYGDAWDCPGDAGGPLLVTVNDQKVQVGIDSWTACYARPKGVGVYTRVQEFLDWIKLHTSEDGRSCAY